MVNDVRVVYSKDKTKIDCCISKLRSCLDKRENFDRQSINQILDELNLASWDAVPAEEKFVCIRICCSLIAPSDTMLIGKCSQVIAKLILNEKLTEPMVLFIARWCTQSLKRSPDISQCEVLTVFEHLFQQNTDYPKQVIDDVISVLKDPIENGSKLVNPGEILLQRLRCIRAIVPSMNNCHFKIVKDVLVELTQRDIAVDTCIKSQIIFVQLEIVSALSMKSISWLCDNLGVVLAISLSFASYGLPHHTTNIPQYLLPTSLLFPDNKPDVTKTNSNNKNRRKKRKSTSDKIKAAPLDDVVLPDMNWSQTSDSDFSDSEMSRNAYVMKSERKIRLSAFSLLLHIVKTVGKKELIGYWNNILDGPYSILKTLSADTSPRSRVAISSILSILFSSGKTFLLQAQHAPKSSNLPYVSWSHLLADLISSTHSVLCDVVAQSQSVGSALSILQCLVIFLRNTPYHRLNGGILKNVVYSISPLLKHVDYTVRVAAIKCLNEVVILEPNTEEQIILMRENCHREFMKQTSDSWIVSYCLESIENEKLAITVRAECWSLLGNLIKHHFINIGCGSRLPKILSILRRDLQDPNVVVQQKAAKAFEQIAVPLGSLDTTCGIDCYSVWLSMLQGPLVPMLQNTSGILASSAADCITNITASVFEQLPEHLRIFVMTALCGCVGHEEHVARSAAVRTLGTIVVFPFLSQSIQIIYDVADRIVSAMKDSNLNVRTKAAWALGNLSDVLLAGRKIGVPIEEVSLLNLLEQAIKTGNDHEKVKACSMRAIGNLFLLVEEYHIQIDRFKVLVEEASVTLIHNASSENNMKVRWNACYSLGNMFKNCLLKNNISVDWHTNAFRILSKLIVSCSNFKVRQAAATAISAISTREAYGENYSQLWPCLMKAFENSQNLTEFSEYKHQRNLIDQLSITLCHLTTFLMIDDLNTLHDLVSPQVESCQKYLSELRRRNKEVDEKFQSAVVHLEQLLESDLKSEQRQTLLLLQKMFQVQDTSSENVQLLEYNLSGE